ncbi:MAG: LamG domain-containing protein [Chloroflexota bacterium]
MPAELMGYADRFSVAPLGTIGFKVSTDFADYEASIVRLIHSGVDGGDNGTRSEFKMETVDAARQQTGRKQTAYAGSYAKVEHAAALTLSGSFTLQAWIWPTTPELGEVQGIISKWSAGNGYVLVIGEGGDLGLWLGDGIKSQRIYTRKTLRTRQWYFVAATFDAETQAVVLYQYPLSNYPLESSAGSLRHVTSIKTVGDNDSPLLMAAAFSESVGYNKIAPRGSYNGKIDSPRLFSRSLSADEIERLRQGESPAEIGGDDLIAAWDFSTDMASATITDTSKNGLRGTLMNMPMRAVTGHNWDQSVYDFKIAPEQYGAIYFHDDDLEDARWETDFEWRLPEGTRSGFYAARLKSGEQEEYIPFFVRPRRGMVTAKAAILVPTMTYLAYANERMKSFPIHEAAFTKRKITKDPLDVYLEAHPEFAMSIYDQHSDGSGCCYSSRLRPIANMHPNYRMWLVGGARHLAAELNLVDWLEAKQIDYDVITDEDLHYEGAELLAHYKVILTGTHPEYWTTPMQDGLESYLEDGGRLMYLGGNGFYWVTAVDPERPQMVEVRRGNGGTRAWNSAPGEQYHSATGEMGGLWRHRGKAPNSVTGIGFSGMGWDSPTPGFERQPGSFDPRAAFIFEGIGANETIGNFGSVLGGAAGDEIDRLDYSLGTPPHALLLATATGHSRLYLPVIEDILELTTGLIEAQDPNVRADMVYFETPNDGAVFSSGSITWCGSLGHNNFDNNVSRITENVLRKFLT